MARGILLAWIVIHSIAITSVHCRYYSQSKPYEPVKLQKTQLHFFLHDTLSGNKPTAVMVASANATGKPNDPTPFGTTFAIDDPLTEGPEITSKVIGNAQGLYLSSSQDKNLTLVMYVDLGFTRGKFKGSSLSVFSRNPVTEGNREMAVVGGRGKFRFARGFIKVKTNYLNITNGDAVLEYKVTVVHPHP
ncbi:dirigent 4-like [Olea europaea subsp. europaea]|uniref:Dirigent protein n=1 Tax=Olea europaea subsp. europaea TaxID=158383 RepID=A0A8S0PEV1_OLEEU|nr:dirigent 4-like [Olea europaea subsp. europaea]